MSAARVRRVVIVPGLAVRRYARPAARCLARRGVKVDLRPAPGSPGDSGDLERYGARFSRLLADEPADLLIGLSVGTQAAAVAVAGAPAGVGHLVLVSPTVAPQFRSLPRLLLRWALAGRRESPRLLAQQLPEWARAGPEGVLTVLRSAQRVVLEEVLGNVTCPVTVVHGEDDEVCPHAYAAALAAEHGQRLVIVPKATHSWPYGDPGRFADLIDQLLP